MDRRTKESKEIFGRAISRFTEKALEERNDFLCLRHPWGTELGETRPFFPKPFQRGTNGICVEFSAISSPFDAPRRSLDRVTASFPADLSNQRIVRVTPDHSPSLSLPVTENRVASLWQNNRGKKPVSGRGRREMEPRVEKREESWWNKRGLASPSPSPSEKGWKQRGEAKGADSKNRGRYVPLLYDRSSLLVDCDLPRA